MVANDRTAAYRVTVLTADNNHDALPKSTAKDIFILLVVSPIDAAL